MRNFDIALAAAACLVAVSSAAGQGRTVVSATIVDPGGLPYAGASLTATLTTPVGTAGAYLNGVQIAGVVGPVQLDPTGSFLLNLADNTLVRCATPTGTIVACVPQTQWSFKVTISPGVLPPLGTGPQTCTATLTISGASQNISSSFPCPALASTSNGLGVFKYNPADSSGTGACFTNATCAELVATPVNPPATGAGVSTISPDLNADTFFNSVNDTTGNIWEESTQFGALRITEHSPNITGVFVLEQVGGTTLGGNCFSGGAGSPPCALGYYGEAGDDVVSNGNVNANSQDQVSFQAQIALNRLSPAHANNAAGFLMMRPAQCATTALGVRPCGTAGENAVNLWGMEVQDLEGRGTTQTAGVHIEAQTNPTSTTHNFAIAVESGGGTSQFDGTSTAVNCQLGGAAGTTSPAACTSATAGMIAVPASQTSYTVNTTKVTANSEIFVQQMTDNSGLPSAPACNAGTTNPIQSARVAGTSFSISLTSVASVTCFKFWIVN
jgi:hypothetical protein